eukprot:Em0008g752a
MRHECPICLSAMRNPVQTECGHLFCRGCLEPILDGPNPLCPLDKTAISTAGVFPDNACKREILSLDVYCDASKNGCPWIGPLKELDSHSQGCEYSDVLCRQCGLNVQNRTFSVHQTKECPMRPVQCQFCNQIIPVGQLETHIENVCPQYLRSCPNRCVPGPQFTLQQLEAHLNPRTGDCPLAEILCPFKQYGCTFVCERKKMPLHLNEYQIQHTYLQADYSVVMKGQVDKIIETTEHLSIRVSAVENQMSSVLGLLEGLKQRFENEHDRQNTTTKHTDFVAHISLLHEKMGKLQEDMSNMIVAVQKSNEGKEAITLSSHTSPLGAKSMILERVENISVKTTELEHGLDRCLSSCLDQEVRLQLLERATYNGVLLWKIDDFARRRKEAVDGVTMSLYSIPFYTSRHGYKMCARVYLNGDGMGKGTHLSFFFVVMKGPFDALLPWPFKQKVTLTIINQAGKKHVTDTFRPDPQSNSFQRPTQKEMNVASGCPMFIRHEQLLSGGFVKDDCIFLRSVVDSSIDAEPLMLK